MVLGYLHFKKPAYFEFKATYLLLGMQIQVAFQPSILRPDTPARKLKLPESHAFQGALHDTSWHLRPSLIENQQWGWTPL